MMSKLCGLYFGIKLFFPKGALFGTPLHHIVEYFSGFRWCSVGKMRKLQNSTAEPILYFGKNIPEQHGVIHGGAIKLQQLAQTFRVSATECSILYLVSSSLPLGAEKLIRIAKRRGIKFVWNQNGVSFPASMPNKFQTINKQMARLRSLADHVVYQSEFCKMSAEKLLGPFNRASSIIYNCVDTDRFKPREDAPSGHPTVLIGGNIYKKSKFDLAIQTLSLLRKQIPDVKMIMTGNVHWVGATPNVCKTYVAESLNRYNLANHIEFTGSYSQIDAPNIYSKANVLLHTKSMDPCPGLVIEALACGLPVVYLNNGGTPELVGDKAGIGIAAPIDWEKEIEPQTEILTQSLLTIFQDSRSYSGEARTRAETRFSIKIFMTKHQSLFQSLLS